MRSKLFTSGKETGAIALLLAILVAIIFAFVGLAIDSARFSSSKRESKLVARQIALGALEAYLSAAKTLSESEKLQVAVNRANELVSKNIDSGNGGSGNWGASPLRISIDNTINGYSRTSPVIIPGRYFFIIPPDNTNPCQAGSAPPCFRPLRDGEVPNSMRIEGPLFKDVWGSFSAMSLSTRIRPYADVTATILPRRGCFLVDISASMSYDTHPIEAGKPRKRFAYYLDDPTLTTHINGYEALPSTRVGGWVPTVHYKDDYVPISLLNDENFASDPEFAKHHPNPAANPAYSSPPRSPGVPHRYWIDKYYESPRYKGPEPLATVFEALNGAVQQFKERKVGGDKVCLIFYDNDLLWHRIFNLDDDFDYVQKFTDLSKRDPDGKEGFYRAMRYGAFPRARSFTNTMQAINEAANQFRSNSQLGVPTSDFAVLIGDGLTNCRNCSSQAELGNYCGSGGPGCANRFDYLHYSSIEAIRVADSALKSQKIPIHIVQTGAAVGPHSIDWGNSTGGCLSEFEKRTLLPTPSRPTPSLQTPFWSVQPLRTGQEYPDCPLSFSSEGSSEASCDTPSTKWSNLFKAASPSQPFLFASDSLYRIALTTGGNWYPLRPSGSNCNPCLPGTLRTTDPLCRSSSTQLADAITDIMSHSPFTIVEDR